MAEAYQNAYYHRSACRRPRRRPNQKFIALAEKEIRNMQSQRVQLGRRNSRNSDVRTPYAMPAQWQQQANENINENCCSKMVQAPMNGRGDRSTASGESRVHNIGYHKLHGWLEFFDCWQPFTATADI